jgi:hypothetical protein
VCGARSRSGMAGVAKFERDAHLTLMRIGVYTVRDRHHFLAFAERFTSLRGFGDTAEIAFRDYLSRLRVEVRDLRSQGLPIPGGFEELAPDMPGEIKFIDL